MADDQDFTPASVFNLSNPSTLEIPALPSAPDYPQYTYNSGDDTPGILTRLSNTLSTYTEDKRVLAVLCLLAPPLAVFMTTGAANRKVALSIFLYLFFIVPGVFFSFYICFLEGPLNGNTNSRKFPV